jgi:hypothetical protein
VECVRLQARGDRDPDVIRVSSGLSLHAGHYPQLPALLIHLFAGGPKPDLARARVEFVIDGAAYEWNADFTLGTTAMINRSTGRTFSDPVEITAHVNSRLTGDLQARVASFATPEPGAATPNGFPVLPGEPPSSDRLASELAALETRLRGVARRHDTATALYSDLFPLLEALETAAAKLQKRVAQLEKHEAAESALAEYRRMQALIEERLEAGRRAREVEKQLSELRGHDEELPLIPDATVEQAEMLEADVTHKREEYVGFEKKHREVEARLAHIRSLPMWLIGALFFPAAAIPTFIAAARPYAQFVWATAALLLLAWPLAMLRMVRRSRLRSTSARSRDDAAASRRNLELAELALRQKLQPFGARDAEHLRDIVQQRQARREELEDLETRQSELRRVAGTDDPLRIHSAQESALLAELEERSRSLAPYRLSDSDRESIEQMVHELETEARYQKQAAAELRKQCEDLSDGWSRLPVLTERVAGLRRHLAEWQRWESAFRRIRQVIDRLPDIPDLSAPGPEAGAAGFLERITAGRWTRLHFDPVEAEFKLYDQQAGLWVRADRDHATMRSTVELAYRLSLVEQAAAETRLPLWILEPFRELPQAMADATAAVLAEVAARRQVVLVCRQEPQVQWPEGAARRG